jgi:DNA-binding MarR family transcriptional regulator
MPSGEHHHSDALLDELFMTMVQLGRTVVKQYVVPKEGGPHGLPRLMALQAIGGADCCKAGDLAQTLGVKAPAASALIDGLERDGLVVREHSAEDKRVVNVRLTEAGAATLERLERHRRAVMREKFSILSDEDLTALVRIQKTLIEAMAGDAPVVMPACEKES